MEQIKGFASVLQGWVMQLTLMQQTVLLTAIRGPDGLPKYHPTKALLRWFRRCILLSALDRKVLLSPYAPGGRSFTGPSSNIPHISGEADAWEAAMEYAIRDYLRSLDEVPHHFQMHFMHAAEIVGYKHPDERIRAWWNGLYVRLVHDMHLFPETEAQLDQRLGDTREGWLARADEATVA